MDGANSNNTGIVVLYGWHLLFELRHVSKRPAPAKPKNMMGRRTMSAKLLSFDKIVKMKQARDVRESINWSIMAMKLEPRRGHSYYD
mmetsp:Transcript_11834/g.18168  ORF Transcript_11834/g.18168 Transcript_11834/m.18168 type:complete len:87 (-) Transcript_11834:18-278(-)